VTLGLDCFQISPCVLKIRKVVLSLRFAVYLSTRYVLISVSTVTLMLSKANDVNFDFLDNLLVAKILRFPSKVFFLSDQVYA